MEIKGISSYEKSISTKKDILDKNAFLKILTVQLNNQDPLNAKDNTEYIAQMAQFSALEQAQNMNASMEKLLFSQKISEGSLLIGREVTFINGENTVSKERVKGVLVGNNTIYLKTENQIYSIDDVVEVGEIPVEQQSGESEPTEI